MPHSGKKRGRKSAKSCFFDDTRQGIPTRLRPEITADEASASPAELCQLLGKHLLSYNESPTNHLLITYS